MFLQVLDLLGLGSAEDNQSSGRIPPLPGSTLAVAPPQQPVVLPDLMDGWDAPEGTDGVQVILLVYACLDYDVFNSGCSAYAC